MRKLAALVLLFAFSAHAEEVTIPNEFVGGTAAVASEVNANFDAVATSVDDNASDIDALQAADSYEETWYCDAGTGGDIGAKCNDVYADMVAAGRGGTLVVPSGQYTQSTTIDVCDETGLQAWVPVRIKMGATTPAEDLSLSQTTGRSATRLIAGPSLATSAITKTTFAITVDVSTPDGLSTRDQVTCVGCDFRAAGFRRNDLVELSGFADAANNHGRAVDKMPLKVYRATTTTLILEGEISVNPAMTTQAASATGEIRRLSSQIETCHMGQYVEGGELDGDETNEYADIGIRHRPDNAPNAECSANDTPYNPECSGDGTGTLKINHCINCGVREVATHYQKYFGIAAASLEISGQSDQYIIANSYVGYTDVGIYFDLLQAKPALALRDTQIEGYRRNGVRLASGGANIEAITPISEDTDCAADTYGTCAAIEMLTLNTTMLSVTNSNIEINAGDGLLVGANAATARSVWLAGNTFYGNDGDSTDMKMVSIPEMCGVFGNQSNLYLNANTDAWAPTITVSNPTVQATCPLVITGSSTYSASGAESVPVLTVNNSIPSTFTHGTVQIGAGSAQACLMLRDSDASGWSECEVLNGTLSCATDADGICDGTL